MLDSSLLGNDQTQIDVQIEPTEPPKPRSASSLLGNDTNNIDISIPQMPDTSRQEHREAVANARAVRREAAAAKTRDVRRKAAAEAKAIFEAAERTITKVSDSTRSAAGRTFTLVSDTTRKNLERTRKAAAEAANSLASAYAAEEARNRQKKLEAYRDAAQEQAAEQYAAETKAAKKTVKKLRKRSERAFQRDASAFAAKKALPRIERVLGTVNIAVCALLVSCIAIGMVVLERPTVSEIENRALAEKPDFTVESYLSGEYTEGITNYYDDTVPFRSVFKNMTASLRKHFGMQSDDDAVLHGAVLQRYESGPVITTTAPVSTTEAIMQSGTTTPTTTVSTQVTTEAPVSEEDEEGGELSNNILIYQKRAISLYGGSFAVGENYALSLSKYKAALDDDVNVYSMVVPTPCSFYTPDEFKKLIGSEKDNIEHINAYLAGVTPVDAYGALMPHKDEYIYMRTDHHWSALGAFYAAEEFAATARVPFAPMSEYDKVVREGYVGTMYGYSGDITIKNNPEDFFFYQPHANITTTYYNRSLGAERKGNLLMNIDTLGAPVNWYLVYLGGDDRVTHVETEVKNGRKLVVFKDSYGNALIPWLTSSFEDIYVVDIRYFKTNAVKYIKNVGATDVLFAMNTFSATGGNCKQIEKIRRQ